MKRIQTTFQQLQSQGKKALIPYVTAGFPQRDITPALMHAMVQAGANIIELGIPFSDPMADGPVIQQASERALAAGVSLRDVLDMVREFRQQDTHTPVVLMGYANPVECYHLHHGPQSFAHDAAQAGVDGVLIVDYPVQECREFAAQLKAVGIDMIFLLAPTSSTHSMQQVAEIASGYVYYVSLKGVTGAGHLDTDAVRSMLPRIREHIKIPVGVGFGIRDAQTACAIAEVADAVVIGTKIIQLIDNLSGSQAVQTCATFLREIRESLDKTSSLSSREFNA